MPHSRTCFRGEGVRINPFFSSLQRMRSRKYLTSALSDWLIHQQEIGAIFRRGSGGYSTGRLLKRVESHFVWRYAMRGSCRDLETKEPLPICLLMFLMGGYVLIPPPHLVTIELRDDFCHRRYPHGRTKFMALCTSCNVFLFLYLPGMMFARHNYQRI